MAEPDFADPYLDPETGILRNLVGARTSADLDVAEADLVAVRTAELAERPPPATGDLSELKAIHRALFQDVYAWAGEVRTVDIRKSDWFLPVSMIEQAAAWVVEELRADDYLQEMKRPRLVERLAYHFDRINYMHPFREGNGRTQRLFMSRVASDAGWRLDWIAVDAETNVRACVAAGDGDRSLLESMFDRITHERPPARGHPGRT